MSLVKTVATVGGWTLVYRLSSFMRDILQAKYLGAGMFADVFSLAFKFANILRKIFAEGAFNASFLPIFSNTLKDKGEDEARKLASQVFTWLVILISFLMILCLVFSSISRHCFKAAWRLISFCSFREVKKVST